MDFLFEYSGTETPLNLLDDSLRLESVKPTLSHVLKGEVSTLELVWKILSLGKCWLFRVKNKEDVTVHQSMLIGWNPKFPFLRKNEFEIGPCYTIEEYRGHGIYPYVLQHLVSSNGVWGGKTINTICL